MKKLTELGMKDIIKAMLVEHYDRDSIPEPLIDEITAYIIRTKFLEIDRAFCAGFIAGASSQVRYDKVIIDNVADNLKPSFLEYISTNSK